jgi:AraC-like DNA-binding protein
MRTPPKFLFRRPSPPLDQLVECLWSIRGAEDYSRYKVLPNGAIEMIVNLGEDVHGVVDESGGGRVTQFRRSWLAGFQHGALTVESLADGDLMAARFKPGGAWPFLVLDLVDISDRVFELEDMLGPAARSLRERLLHTCGPQARFDVFECFLRELLLERSGDTAIMHVCRMLDATHGLARIATLVEQTGLSHKRLLQRFRSLVGTTPKALARVHRFHRVILLVGSRRQVDWSEIACDCGYSDQAHFNHDFRAYTGLTPTRYLATRLAHEPNHARLD